MPGELWGSKECGSSGGQTSAVVLFPGRQEFVLWLAADDDIAYHVREIEGISCRRDNFVHGTQALGRSSVSENEEKFVARTRDLRHDTSPRGLIWKSEQPMDGTKAFLLQH